MIYIDSYINNIVSDNAGPALVKTASIISFFGSTEVVSIVTILLLIFFLFRKKLYSGMVLLFSVGSSAIIVYVVKELIARLRPENAFEIVTGYSFPSGHAALSAAFITVVIYLLSKTKTPKCVLWIMAIIPILIGLSRVVLNVHWTTDVIGGWFVGIFCASLFISLMKKRIR